jgi:hypothetical protein
MINNEATLSSAPQATSGFHADRFSVSKAFYDQVRSRFLKQSANYLRVSLNKNRAISLYTDNHRAQS